MATVKIIKQPSDLITNTIIKTPSLGSNVAPVALLRQGDVEGVVLVHDIDEMPDLGFDETTPEYARVEAMFDLDGFNGPVLIGTYQSGQVISLNDVVATPTDDGATISATVPGVQKWFEDHMFGGPKWYIPVGMSDDDIKTAADILYTNQRGELVHRVNTIEELQEWHDYAESTQHVKNKLGHFRVVVEKDPELYPEAQAVAYASTVIKLDWMRIGGSTAFTQFVPDDWTQVERDMIDNLNGLTVVNKAGDNMLSGNKELNGNEIDNSFNAEYNTEYIQLKAQKWLNGNDYTEFTDDNINELLATVQAAGDDLFKQGTIASTIDGKADFSATAVARSQVSAYEITQRTYKSLNIKQTLPSAIEKVYLNNSITL